VHVSAFADRSRMLNGVRDQLIHDECKRHCHVSGDDERIGIDDKRPRPIRAARRSRNVPTEINKVTVQHHRSNIVILVKLLVNCGDGRDARSAQADAPPEEVAATIQVNRAMLDGWWRRLSLSEKAALFTGELRIRVEGFVS